MKAADMMYEYCTTTATRSIPPATISVDFILSTPSGPTWLVLLPTWLVLLPPFLPCRQGGGYPIDMRYKHEDYGGVRDSI